MAFLACSLLASVYGSGSHPLTQRTPPVGPRVLLKNSADANVTMPLAGLGMPCGPTYACSAPSYTGTATFLNLGGRRTDSAISYSGSEPGIGLAMREWIADGGDRAELFIGSKIGPGGACWPLGHNESITQAKMIVGFYDELNSSAGRSPPAVGSVGQLDTLLIHWPVNGLPANTLLGPPGRMPWPCGCATGSSIPTTDPACDLSLPTYDERGCRVSTWRGMVTAWKMGLTRSIGVSNFNSTMIQDLVDAGLPLPAVNQIEWSPGVLAPGTSFPPKYSPFAAETFAAELEWCQQRGVLVNGWSPFGGSGQAGNTFSKPAIKSVAAKNNVSAAQVILRWNVQLGVAFNPMATNPSYQQENLDVFGFALSGADMQCLGTLNASQCPLPPFPTCNFSSGGAKPYTMDLSGLPAVTFTLTDRIGDKYAVVSPCRYADGTSSPAVEEIPGVNIPLGYATDLSIATLPSGADGLRLTFGNGNVLPGCDTPRVLWFDMVCDKAAPASSAPNATMIIPGGPDSPPGMSGCSYLATWHTPAACNVVPPPPPPCVYDLNVSGTKPFRMNLSKLPPTAFALTDHVGDKYEVVSPCHIVAGTSSPAVEVSGVGVPAGGIPLGYVTDLTVQPLPGRHDGLRLMLGNGGTVGCPTGRSVWYDMVCDADVPANSPPNSTMYIGGGSDPNAPILPSCVYLVWWRTPLACDVGPAPSPSPRTPPLPTAAQVGMMDTGLAQFMHFSVDTWSDIEHNCVPVGTSDCLPASLFAPTNLSTDQWVEAAVAMGAGEICLTAHHEGGFCLWDSKYTNYSVMHSPYGKDVVAQFVKSCAKYNVKPCFYMGPNANGYLMRGGGDANNATAFIDTQLGMLRELLTKYGTNYVSRLWWDHYSPWDDSCAGDPNVACPTGSFPDAWYTFVKLVRDLSPDTVICPGPDCDGHQGESGVGNYPTWYPCTQNTAANTPPHPNGSVMSCGNHAADASLNGFHPYETCGTLLDSGYFCRPSACGPFWTAKQIWDHYLGSVGIGWVNTLNAPPGTDGQIPAGLVANMASFGSALRALLVPVGNTTTLGKVQCGADIVSAPPLVLELTGKVSFDSVMIREDLSHGQRIEAYGLDYFDDVTSSWRAFPTCPDPNQCLPDDRPGAIPPVPRDTCSPALAGVNLVNSLPPSAHFAGMVDNATACRSLCKTDPGCNFWTWHDLSNPAPWPNKCYVRMDAVYTPDSQAGHVSGICNQTLPSTPASGGVHGQSVGARLFDCVGNTTTTKVRFRCTSSLASDGTAFVASLSVHNANEGNLLT